MKSRLAIVGGALVGVLAASAFLKPRRKTETTKPPKTPKGPTVTSNYEGDLRDLSDDPVTRSAQIASLIRSGRFEAPFTRIETSSGDKRAKLAVSSRALTVDGVRVSMTERDQQKIADYFGAHLLTPFLVKTIYQQADARLEPRPQTWYADGSMAKTRRVFDYDAVVTQELGERDGLIANEGKDWVLDSYAMSPKGIAKGTNYGWLRSNGTAIQEPGHAHNLDHVDYSQLARFVSSVAQVSDDAGSTWRDTTFEELLRSPTYYPLVSYERLPSARHPGVAGGIVV